MNRHRFLLSALALAAPFTLAATAVAPAATSASARYHWIATLQENIAATYGRSGP